MTVSEIREQTGLSRAAFSRKYNIPVRTLENWEKQKAECPPYVVELLQRAVMNDIRKGEHKMKAYFWKNDAYNAVVLTDGCTVKVYDCAPSGRYDGIDLYSDDAVEQLKKYFKDTEDDANDYDSMYCSNGEISYEDAVKDGVFDESVLIYEEG